MNGFAAWLGATALEKKLKSEWKNTFGSSDEPEYLPSEYDPRNDESYNKEQHQSWGARRAQQSFSRSLTNAKSDAVREAQERRAAAAAAKAKKNSKR